MIERPLRFHRRPGRRCGNMGKIVFGMMQSLDGYVAGVEGRAGAAASYAARRCALSVLDRPRPRYRLQSVRPPHVRSDALLGGESTGVGRSRARIRGGMADAAQMGCITLATVGRRQRHPHRRRSRSFRSPAEDGGRRRHRRCRARSGGKSYGPRSHRRVSALLSSVCSRLRQTVLRRCSTAAPVCWRHSVGEDAIRLTYVTA